MENHPGLSDFLQEFPIPVDSLSLSLIPSSDDAIRKSEGGVEIRYTKESRLYRSLAYLKAHPRGEYEHRFSDPIHELSFLLDCSRNAVMKVEMIQKLIRYLAFMGYDSLMLYTEDTYEIKEEPFFGYFRGRYSEEEIHAIDVYAQRFGIELIPCIQTLAHLNALKQWAHFEKLFDIDDILLADNEGTYALIEEMIASLARSYSSRRVNIGMDEAHLLGRGRHQDLHGAEERFPIMMRHLKRVLGIVEKYGFKAMMWSDMFASVINPDGTLRRDLASDAPSDVTLVYWDYYSSDEAHYDAYMKLHRLLPNPLAFATACWKWSGYTPQNRLSFLLQKPAFQAAIHNHISDVIVTAWGDNGGETSPFAVLPAVLFASLARQGLEENDPVLFEAMTGVTLEEFLELDLANLLFPDSLKANTQNKIFLLMDPLLSPFDSLVPEGAAERYEGYAVRLAKAERDGKGFRYLFSTQKALNSFLAVKTPLGLTMRAAYQKGDRSVLEAKLLDLQKCRKRLRYFMRVYEKQWLKENKPEGFEVQSLRLGGLMERLCYAERTLRHYLNGKTKRIDELEITLLDYYGKEAFTKPDDNCEYRWRRLSSVGVNE